MRTRRPDENNGDKTAALRVAVLYFGGEDLVEPVVGAGLEIAYLYDDAFGTEYLDFEDIPPFDLVAASVPATTGRQERALGLALRFIRERRPISYALLGAMKESRMARLLEEEAHAIGYRTETVNECVAIGTLREEAFTWPEELLSGTKE